MKRIGLLSLIFVLLCAASLGEQASGYMMQPSKEVLEYLDSRFEAYTLEDYCEVINTPAGDYGFALVKYHGVRVLLGFRNKGGVMEHWMDSMGAVPQTERKASFFHREVGSSISYIWDSENEHQYTTDGFNIGVSVPNEWYETTQSRVYYEWEQGTFRLKSYRNDFYDVDIVGDTLYFWDIGNGLRNTVKSYVETDICRVGFDQLPRQAGDVTQSADKPPVIPWSHELNALYAEPYVFAPGKKYPVYNGPGAQYQRAGEGKASVSTNGWIQVFGEYDGWLMIQYAIDDDRCRIGWIPRDALTREQYVFKLQFLQDDHYTLCEPWQLTDDPLCSRMALCVVPDDVNIEGLAKLGYGWMYVRVTVDGKIWYGFLPADILGHG